MKEQSSSSEETSSSEEEESEEELSAREKAKNRMEVGYPLVILSSSQ